MPEASYKLVVSDFHMGKGRVLEDGSVNSLEEFYHDGQFAEFLDYHTSGEFQGATVELILNGDFLDFLQVDYRGHYLTTFTEDISVELLEAIWAGHPKVFEALKSFAAESGHSISYVVGNRDQPMLWPAAQERFRQLIKAPVDFYNMVYRKDGFHIEHGHRLQAFNQFNPKKFFLRRNLPEPILNLPFGSHFFCGVLIDVKKQYPHFDRVRPIKRLIRWGLINETIFTLKTLFRLATYFLKLLLKPSPQLDFSVFTLVNAALRSTWGGDLAGSAQKILEKQEIHTVIFGHTYLYKHRQYEGKKEYFNTGTWTELTSLEIPHMGVMTKLTYVLVSEGEERVQTRLKQWRGYHRVEEDVVY